MRAAGLRFVAVLLLLAGAPAPLHGQSAFERKPARYYQLTPTSVAGDRGVEQVQNPIAHALEQAGPGSVLQLAPGAYPAFSIGVNTRSGMNARTSGGLPSMPITIEGHGRVVIHAGGGGADTILVSQQVPNGHFLFRNLIIVPGYRTAVMFARGGVHEGFRFWDCHIIGEYDHGRLRGPSSKWGVWGSQVKDFEFKGITRKAEVRNIQHEHGFYLQNTSGTILIENVLGRFLGRTFCQFTSRPGEGPPGSGQIILRNCDVNDVALAPGDAHKGGSAFTFGGRHTGTIRVENCSYRCGFDSSVSHLTTAGSPYGTGALMMVDSGGGLTERLILKDNQFLFHERAGDRAVVSIGGAKNLEITGRNRLVAGAYGVALELDPVREDGRGLKSHQNGRIRIDSGTVIQGRIERAGREVPPDQLQAQIR